MLLRENLDSIQDLIFILTYKFHVPEQSILDMRRWVIKKRFSQFERYQKEKSEAIQKEINASKSQMPRHK